ncbi:MAG: response regulator transcription factor [Phenylobacterium sp.]|jgi:two-component system OmpR family response regulator|uniref:response regulator transcription factor n=1 Tax=Phenylobacterium sp. TaxID=1871053 RepID=UPI001A29AB0E|nr:response regulator transcription factor [Phenylobacterium sp.]MBJ7412872.1 response regulator transcription factor [Phenylobacterium sp.]
MTALAFEFAAGAAPARPHVAQGSPRVLWIDADAEAIEPGLEMLRRHGFEVARADSAAEAQPTLDGDGCDLVILETALPDADGLALCRKLSEAETAPVLVVARAADTLDRVAGLEFGADDVLPKTTHPLELLAKVRALLRRAARQARHTAQATLETWRFDAELGYVTAPSGRTVRLSPADAALLRALAARPGVVLPRDALVALLHGEGSSTGGRSIDARVARLRRTLSACDGAGDMIKTLRGGGYLFQAQVTARTGLAA